MVFAGVVLALALFSPARAALPSADLIVYAYDSFVSKDGLGPEVVATFQKKCACKVALIGVGDASQLVARLRLEAKQGKSVAHVAIGLDQNLWLGAKDLAEDWGRWLPKGYSRIAPEHKVESGFLPFDYGVFALIADTTKIDGKRLPRSWSDLLDPYFQRKLILQDPRTSTPGLGFVLGANEAFGERRAESWKKLRTQWLTLAPGWDQAYGIFLKGEAPLVWSYVTSEAYHRENGHPFGRYKAVVFEEGNPGQIEGAILVRGTLQLPKTRQLAMSFLETLISREIQSKVPTRNWMHPIVDGVDVPRSYHSLPKPKRVWMRPRTPAELQATLKEWSASIRR